MREAFLRLQGLTNLCQILPERKPKDEMQFWQENSLLQALNLLEMGARDPNMDSAP